MAVTKRERSKRINGKAQVSWQVKWRYLGNGPWQTVTVDNRADAKALDDGVAELGRAVLKTDTATIAKLMNKVVTPEQSPEALLEAAGRSVTVRQAFTEWMDRPVHLAASTGKRDRTHLARLGDFGDRQLGTLTKADVWQWLSTLMKQDGSGPMAEGTKRGVRVALQAALTLKGYGALVDAEWYEEPLRVKDPVYLTTEQQAVLMAAAKAEGLALPAKVALFCGLRLGEVLGLQVKHLDLADDGGTIHVVQALPETATLAGGFRPGQLKTKAKGMRVVVVPAWLTWELQDHVRGLSRDAVVFTPTALPAHEYGTGVRRSRPPLGVFWTRGTFHRRWRAACEAAKGVPDGTRFHDLRHTCAKDWLEGTGGATPIPPHIVAELLGDTLEVVMDTYAGFGSSSLALARAGMSNRPVA